MNEQFPSRSDDSSAASWDRLPATTHQFAPVERFPPEHFPTERFPTERFPTEQFPAARFPAERFPTEQIPAEQFPAEGFPTRPVAGTDEPLAHEGGLPYGNSPAAPYRPDQDFLPQHLAAPPSFAHSPYPPGPHAVGPYAAGPFAQGSYALGQYQPFMPQPFAPQPFAPNQYPYPMQQTVFVTNGGGRRVNHVLHLILTILTFGLWLPVWAVLAVANS